METLSILYGDSLKTILHVQHGVRDGFRCLYLIRQQSRPYHMWSNERCSGNSDSPGIYASKVSSFNETQGVPFEVTPICHQLLDGVKEILPESQSVTFCIFNEQKQEIRVICKVSPMRKGFQNSGKNSSSSQSRKLKTNSN